MAISLLMTCHEVQAQPRPLSTPGSQNPPSPPPPSALEQARGHYERGIRFYTDGAYDSALVEFDRAYDGAPSYRILYNIGLVRKQMADAAGALRAFTRYLAEGQEGIAAERRAEVEVAIAELRKNVATLRIQTNVDGAEITVDDVPVGRAPLANGIDVNAGQHRITATHADRMAASTVVSTAASESPLVELSLQPQQPSAAPAPATSSLLAPRPPNVPAPTVEPSPRNYRWIGWVATGALGAASLASGVAALNAASSLKAERDSANATTESLRAAQSNVRLYSVAADVTAGAAAITLGVSLYFALTASQAAAVASPHPEGRPVRLAIEPNGILVRGEF